MTKKNTFQKLIQYYKPYKALFFMDMIFALFSSISALAVPLIVKRLIIKIGKLKESEALNPATLKFLHLDIGRSYIFFG